MMWAAWLGQRWQHDRRIEREVLRSHASMLREQAAVLREDASLTRWHCEREREYARFLRDEGVALRLAMEARQVRSDPPAECIAIHAVTLAEGRAVPSLSGA